MADDLDIRVATEADAEAISRVHVASWRTAYRGVLPDAYLDGMMDGLPRRIDRWRAGLHRPEAPGTATFLAERRGHGPVGFATAGGERRGRTDYRGELHAIYLLDEHRRQGIGRRLFTRCVDHVRDLGHEAMLVWVLRDNPWRAFYAALGGVVVPGATMCAEIAGLRFEEIAYGWRPLPSPWTSLATGAPPDAGAP